MKKYILLISLICFSSQIEHCQRTKKVCKTCISGYTAVFTKDNYECINTSDYEAIKAVKEHCIKGDPENQICNECERDYSLNEKNNCVENTHCYSPNGNLCESCKGPYALDGDTSKCVKKPYCSRISGGKCVDCDDYYYPNNEGNCTKNPDENCWQGDSTGCTYCDSTYYINSHGVCTKIPFDHCSTGNSAKCETCVVYYYMKNNICIENPPHCKIYAYNSLSEKCMSCDYYFHPEGTQCVANPDHCSFMMDNRCTNCETGYYLEDNECKYMTVQNCETLEDSTHCKTCESGYILNEDKTKCEDLCQEYEEVCSSCQSNYVTYDYGRTCEVVDPSIIPPDEDKCGFIELNLVMISLILSLIL